MEVDRIEVLKEVFAQNVQAASFGFKRQHQKRVGKGRHKSCKQLLSDEQKRINNECLNNGKVPKVTYFNVEAPPSLKPAKKYCDITGLKANYRSPTNNIRYHNAEIYQLVVKPMAAGVDQEYLKLRGANFVLK